MPAVKDMVLPVAASTVCYESPANAIIILDCIANHAACMLGAHTTAMLRSRSTNLLLVVSFPIKLCDNFALHQMK